MGKSGPSSRLAAHAKGWALPSLGMWMWTSWTRQQAHWTCWALFHDLHNLPSSDLKSKSWAYKDLNAGAFLGYSESFFWTDPGFLHLSDHKFCLLLHSVRSPDRVFFLYCIVVDLSAFIGHSCFPKKPLLHSVVSVQKYSLDKRIDLLDCMIM